MLVNLLITRKQTNVVTLFLMKTPRDWWQVTSKLANSECGHYSFHCTQVAATCWPKNVENITNSTTSHVSTTVRWIFRCILRDPLLIELSLGGTWKAYNLPESVNCNTLLHPSEFIWVFPLSQRPSDIFD